MMLEIILRYHITYTDIRKRTKVDDVMERKARMKWNWVGHVAR